MADALVAFGLTVLVIALIWDASTPEPKVINVDPHTIVVTQGDKTAIYKEVK